MCYFLFYYIIINNNISFLEKKKLKVSKENEESQITEKPLATENCVYF